MGHVCGGGRVGGAWHVACGQPLGAFTVHSAVARGRPRSSRGAVIHVAITLDTNGCQRGAHLGTPRHAAPRRATPRHAAAPKLNTF